MPLWACVYALASSAPFLSRCSKSMHADCCRVQCRIVRCNDDLYPLVQSLLVSARAHHVRCVRARAHGVDAMLRARVCALTPCPN